ncbi:MAG: hypothetical protein PVG19_07185 [Desulfobacterales bacterium]
MLAGLAEGVVVTFPAGRRPPSNRHETIDLPENIETGTSTRITVVPMGASAPRFDGEDIEGHF